MTIFCGFAQLVGAWAIAKLEEDNEKEKREVLHEIKREFLDRHPSVNSKNLGYQKSTRNIPNPDPSSGSEVEDLLSKALEFHKDGISALDKHRYVQNWAFGQSVMFTVTVVTTIGTWKLAFFKIPNSRINTYELSLL